MYKLIQQRMKIVYLYTSLRTVGGADRIISEKANYLADHYNHEVYFITDTQMGLPLTFPLSPKVRHIDLGIDFNRQYFHGILKRGIIYLRLMKRYKKELSQLLLQIQPDIVISTLSREADFLTELKDGSKKIAEIHIAKDYIRNLYLMRKQKGIYPWIARVWTKKMEKAVKHFDAVVVLTHQDAKSWQSIRPVCVIPNFLPFYPEKVLPSGNKKIISVGRLYEQKGYDLLIEVWKIVTRKHPDWHLHIYGNGEQENELTGLIAKYGIGETFHLEEPVKDILTKYAESAFYVMSSRFEGFGMVLIEAMACGLPCISFDCPHGPSDIIKDQEDGFLVENGNIQALAEKINILIEQPEKRQRMGEQARINVKRYDKTFVMQQWIELFNQLTGPHESSNAAR